MVKEEVERCQLWQQHRKVFCVSCNYQVSSWQRPSTLFSPLSPSTSKVRRGSTKVGSVSQSDEIRDQCHQHGDQAQKEKPQYDGHDAQSSRPSGKLRRRLWVLRLLRLDWTDQRFDPDAGEPADDAAHGQFPVVLVMAAGCEALSSCSVASVCICRPRRGLQWALVHCYGRVGWVGHFWPSSEAAVHRSIPRLVPERLGDVFGSRCIVFSSEATPAAWRFSFSFRAFNVKSVSWRFHACSSRYRLLVVARRRN